MTKTATELKCVHGISYLTCVHCAELTKKDVIAELKEAEARDGVVFDYIELNESEAPEMDTDYDLEVDS